MGIRIVGWLDLPDDPDFRARVDEEEEAYPVEDPLSGKNMSFPPYLEKFEELPVGVRKKALLGAVLILLSPVLMRIALLVVLTSSGPALYTQWRVGRRGSLFRLYKFRTMWEDADKRLKEILRGDPGKSEQFRINHKIEDDPRVPPFGRFLRRTSLDEFPQIFNVLRGEMRLVGPRPVTQEELDSRYKDAAEDYCLVNPGMAGLWQVSGRSERGYGVRIRLGPGIFGTGRCGWISRF